MSTAPYTEATPTTSSAPSSTHTPRTPTGTTAPRKPSPSPTPTRTAKHQPTPTQPRRPVAPAATTPSQITGTVDTTTTAPAPPPATAPVLRRGDSGPEVAELQDRLAQLTIYNGRIDGRFNSKTENAVRTYQSYMGLQSDPPGVYGPETRRALEAQTS
ncbi:peptidoglycan-binding protein [Streptomyces sp. NPDC051597]|uniref:peptidoglycan-binding domain-containing protein n=1 Tax=Streptomyces sp. NPDC051597 TaxID=3155049 RepID=UPI0034120F84